MSDAVSTLAESVSSASSGVSTIYGEPAVVDGVTLVPVALRWFGFGVGTGSEGDGSESSGTGGGGGGAVIPIGAYIKDDFGLRFHPNVISALAVAVPLTWVAGRALARIIRALKK